MTDKDVDSVDLIVTFDMPGKQVLLWNVALNGAESAALVQVDALTGEARLLGRG